MSLKSKTALLAPECTETPIPGRALTVGPGNTTSAANQLESGAIKDGALGISKLGDGLRGLVFGGGRDGEADFDGTSTVQGLAPSGNVYTMTRGLSCTRVNVRSGVTLKPAGYVLQCRELHLWGTAVISRDGLDGNAGVTPTLGAKASGASDIIVGGSGDGGNGGQGGETAAEGGDPGVAGSSATYGYGGGGGTGGDGSSFGGGGSGGTGAAGGSAAASLGVSTLDLSNITRLAHGLSLIKGGAGGGGGGGGGASGAGDDGGGGGGGASGGGVLLILCDRLALHSWSGSIHANGGTGGAGANSINGDGGGGGGGGGGFVQVVYGSIDGGLLVQSPSARNGASVSGANVTADGGAGGGSPGAGTDGSAGTAGLVVIEGPDLYVPAAERPPIPSIRPPFASPARLHAGHRTRR